MTWTKNFQDTRANAHSLSDIEGFRELVRLADTVGSGLKSGGVSSRQIRVLLSETTAGVSRIRRGRTLGLQAADPETVQQDKTQQDSAAKREAALLNISLIYNAGREKSGGQEIKQLAELMNEMTSHVNTFEDFKVLRKFSEAVMAYFKYYGGK